MSDTLRWGDLRVRGDARRRAIAAGQGNGVDGVEVRGDGRGLDVYFIEHAPGGLGPGHCRVVPPPGGRPVRAIRVRRARDRDPELEDRLVVELDHPGSAGRYRLELVEPRGDGTPGRIPLRGLDPRYTGASFAFDVDAPLPPVHGAPPGSPFAAEEISYLGRDYAGLLSLMLDRLTVTMPQWSERHQPDGWITLLELLAYAGDDLSYYQDAVATEAYLQTARNRISVRRHARLLGYRLSEGCAARAWICLEVSAPVSLPLAQVRFAAAGGLVGVASPVLDGGALPAGTLTTLPQYTPLATAPGSPAQRDTVELRPGHNAIELWSWGERDSRLVTGATRATLVDHEPARGQGPGRALALAPGDVLVLEQTADPATGGLGPADPSLRQAVRLTAVRRRVDPLYDQPLLEVRWDEADALRFGLAVTAAGRPCARASGNVILAGHGLPAQESIAADAPALSRSGLGYAVPFPDPRVVARHQARVLRGLYAAWREQVTAWLADALAGTPLARGDREALESQLGPELVALLDLVAIAPGLDDLERAELEAVALVELLARGDELLAGRRARLQTLARLAADHGPLESVLVDELEQDWGSGLTAPLRAGDPAGWGPAAVATLQDPRAALPALVLEDDGRPSWTPALDLIGPAAGARRFVAELDDDGLAQLRLDGRPDGPALDARYWLGNGAAGNAESEAINAMIWTPAQGTAGRAAAAPPVTAVRNPIAAAGGTDPETTAAAKLAIPGAFADDQPRALVAADYAALAAAVPGVRRAAAQARSSGTETVIEVACQPELGEDPSSRLLAEVREALEPARRIGHRLRVIGPRYRALTATLEVALEPGTIRADAQAQLARLLSSGWTADGRAALFNPVSLAFATTVFASPIVAAAQGVNGVRAVALTRFGFLEPPPAGVSAALTLGALEIARLDNDPQVRAHGYAVVELVGGR